MGVPSYFSHIVRDYGQIIKKLLSLPHIDNLYMDCNSLIYDAVKNSPTYDKTKKTDYEKELINMVCKKIDYYVESLKPRKRVFVAFDGVAPVAKLTQQRDRRYKSWYTAQLQREFEGKAYKEAWNTSAITPGTNFMKELNETVMNYYMAKNRTTIVGPEYIVSSSSEVGEGEHKIFEYMRKYPEYHNPPDMVTLVYGLDADLIMLTLNHLHITPNLYLFRETPEFIKSIDSTLDANTDYLLDIPELAASIVKYIHNYGETPKTRQTPLAGEYGKIGINLENNSKLDIASEMMTNRIKDYIFICFLLGNDFLPHFPALNIRTVGIDVMLNVYRETIGNTNTFLINGMNIQWGNFYKMIKHIADKEDDLLMDEHKKRDKFAKRFGNNGAASGYGRAVNAMNAFGGRNGKNQFVAPINENNTIGEDVQCMDDLLLLPMKERSIEKYINPFERDWEYRYYKALFDVDVTDERKKQICVNYLEGLEWTFNYYIKGCIDWRWCYNYHYAPLFKDLVKYIPQMSLQFITPKPQQSIEDVVQLCYVLPRENLNLLPMNVNIVLLENLSHLYGDDYEFKWAYCRYFWESHAELPRLTISTLEDIVRQANTMKSFAKSQPVDIKIKNRLS
uniref:Xrn1 N-terminal domain-containing protein n=1 Tax=viral metagenome TaxID=1070528 RepID=A0A6C0EVQ4_9ZZZZ